MRLHADVAIRYSHIDVTQWLTRRASLGAALSAFGVCLARPRVAAARVARYSLYDMLNDSEIVIIGAATSIPTVAGSSTAMVAVEQTLWGEQPTTPVVRVNVDSLWECDTSGADVGVRSLMFLDAGMGGKPGDDLYRFVNSGRGCLPIRNDEVSIDTADFKIPEWSNGEERPYRVVAVPLSEILAWIAAQPPMRFPSASLRRSSLQAPETPR